MEETKKNIDEKFCFECGQIIKAKAEICPKCGVRQLPDVSNINNINSIAPNGKSKLAAGLFAIFLGTFGVHKFYLKNTGMGILYFLLCWTFIPTVIGFIEGIIFIVMSDGEFNKKYGNI